MTADAFDPIACPPPAGRECGCPPWVIRCVHFDGRTLVLLNPFLNDAHVTGCTARDRNSYAVAVVLDWRDCNFCGGIGALALVSNANFFAPRSNTETEAIAAFERAAAGLLGREEAQ